VDVFTRLETKQVVIQSLRHCQKEKGLLIHAWCLMTSHLHMVISKSKDPLPDILRNVKKFPSGELFHAVDTAGLKRATCRYWVKFDRMVCGWPCTGSAAQSDGKRAGGMCAC
jgi:REP element-mobilizing transposase RayT